MIRPGKIRNACLQPAIAALSIVSLLMFAFAAATAQSQAKPRLVGEAVENALRRGQITLAGATPFHLQAHITAGGNARPDYTADVEEYWESPAKWRRIVKSSGFSQTLISNGEQISEQNTGDYYPFWLHDLVTALFDPLPMADQLKRMQAPLEIPDDSVKSNSCLNVQAKVGIAPAQNTLGYAFCFGGKAGLLQSVTTPGYHAQFADYQPFKDKMVARSISAEFGPQTIAAKITQLTELTTLDESWFAIQQPTAVPDQLRSSQVGEETARALAVKTPAIEWPAIREGKTSGVLSVYISTDRTGQVREAWPLGPGTPLSDAASKQLLQWTYKPYTNGGATQMEAVLTFAFTTHIENPVHVLKDAEARKLAAHIVEAVVPPGKAQGKRFTVRAAVDESGRVTAVLNPDNVAAALYSAGAAALRKWRFRPYLNLGKPDRFYADIVFNAR